VSEPLVIIGSGGYAQEVLWIVDDINARKPSWNFLGFIDQENLGRKGPTLYGRPVLGGYDVLAGLPPGTQFASGVGSPRIRQKVCEAAENRGLIPCTPLIHPTVVTARHVEIGHGTVIGAGSILAPYASIGRHCAINLHVTVGHDSKIRDYCVLSPGARVSGNAVLEQGVFMGTNATIYVDRHVGAGATVAANSFLLTNLGAGLSAIGIPAKVFSHASEAGTCAIQEIRQNAISRDRQ